MISRRRCQRIAEDWVRTRACEEYHRRLTSAWEPFYLTAQGTTPEETAQAQRKRRESLAELATDALLSGLYDPPKPTIPSFWQRLSMNDWAPPEPTAEQWPMRTRERV